MEARRFVLLDRDGTVIVERHYLADPDGVELLPGAGAGLRAMRALGLGLALITNQSAIGRGLLDPAGLDAIHARLEDLLAAEGVRFDGVYVCPHVPADGCACRKPNPGLAERASRELGFDLRRAFVIGDKQSDIDLGRQIGATAILVRTGYGATVAASGQVDSRHVVDDLEDAARLIRAELAPH